MQTSFWHLPPTHCGICGRLLTADPSIAKGIGPICASKHGKGNTDMKKEHEFSDFTTFEPIGDGIILKRDEEGVYTNIPHLVTHHSPDGYEFGYAGSGPADLALNIVEIILNRLGYEGEREKCWRGDCWNMAWLLHQGFKQTFIASAPREGITIPYMIAEGWVIARMKERTQNP